MADAAMSPAWEGQERKRANLPVRCPVCGEQFRPGVEERDVSKSGRFPYPHIVLHGKPLHAVIVYIDANFKVRGIEGAQSIEVVKGADTLGEILRKWGNPS